jgi:Flp pilus assembly protein TadD
MNDAVNLLQFNQQRPKTDDRFRTRLGRIYLQNGHPELAIAEFNRALSLNPLNTEAKTLLDSATKVPKPKKAA